MTIQDPSQVIQRKIDETRRDVRYLHPIMELMDPEKPIPAEDLIERLLGLLETVSEDQQLTLALMRKMAGQLDRLETRQMELTRIFDLDLDAPSEPASHG